MPTVEIDGNRYTQCSFKSCKLIYRGGGIPLFEGDLESVGGRADAGFLEPVSGNVAANDMRASPCGNQGELPGAATDVEQPGSRSDSEPPEKLLRVLLHIAGEKVVVSRHPCHLQASLKCVKIFARLCRSSNCIHIYALLAFSCLWISDPVLLITARRVLKT